MRLGKQTMRKEATIEARAAIGSRGDIINDEAHTVGCSMEKNAPKGDLSQSERGALAILRVDSPASVSGRDMILVLGREEHMHRKKGRRQANARTGDRTRGQANARKGDRTRGQGAQCKWRAK